MPSREMDFELEMGFFVSGQAIGLGAPIPVSEASRAHFRHGAGQ